MELVLDEFRAGLEQERSCAGGGGGGYCRRAAVARECSGVFSVQ